MKNLRLVSTIAVFLSIILLPYWIYLPLTFIAIVLFPVYWEGIVFGFLIDTLYGGGVEMFPGLFSSFSFISFILLIIVVPIKERIRIHV